MGRPNARVVWWAGGSLCSSIQVQPAPSKCLQDRVLGGVQHVPVINLPSLEVFKPAMMKVLFSVGYFPSLGEEPNKFFDSVLGVFMTALLADAGVERGVAMVVIDVMPPMATSIKTLHQGDNLVDYHQIDSITYFKALPDGLQKIFTMNHDAIVRFLVSQREQILEGATTRQWSTFIMFLLQLNLYRCHLPI